MSWVGTFLILSGVLLIFAGLFSLALAAVQLARQIFQLPSANKSLAATGVNLSDLSKLIDSILKMPLWLLAILAGDIQVWLGYLVEGRKLLP